MISRDEAYAAAAVQVLLKSTGTEARRCASAALAALGIDPDAAVAEARGRAPASGVRGPLVKAGAAAVHAGAVLDGGGTVALDMSRREAVDLVVSLQDALDGREAVMDLSLNEAEREHLAALGIGLDAQGVLRSAAGREVSAGTAAALLTKAAVSPADFRRGPLTEGHAAASATQWTTGYPGSAAGQRQARTGPAGPLASASAGSGTADADMGVRGGPVAGLDGGSGDEIDPDTTGTGEDAADLAKDGLMAASFRRHYLTAGRQSDSPANGPQRIIPAPHMDAAPGGPAHVAEPQRFGRGALTAGHQAPPPADDPGGNNDCPPGASAAEVYAAAERRHAANRDRERAEHLTPSTMSPAAPLPERVMLPSDMRAGSVPTARQVQATRPAPGEC